MKRSSIFAVVLVGCCLVASTANSQQLAITEDQYDKAVGSALGVSGKRIRRITTVIETRTKEGRVTSKSHHVAELIPPELERFVDTITSGDVATTEEIIQIGRFGYQKKDESPWVEWTGTPDRGLSVRMMTSRVCWTYSTATCTYSSQQGLLEGQVVRMLSRVGKEKIHGSIYRELTKVWISREGALLRSEQVESEESSSDWTRRAIATWEYDPAGLKIEAPIK